MVGGSDYCHKNIKSNMTTVVHSQMHSYSTSFIKIYGTKEKVTEKKYQRQKKVPYKKKKKHEKGRGWSGEEVNLKVLLKK